MLGHVVTFDEIYITGPVDSRRARSNRRFKRTVSRHELPLGKHYLSMSSASSIAMASNSDTVSDSHTNSLSNRSESQPDNDFTHNELKGWLLKRGRLSRKWKKQWFQLKNCDLYYGNTSEVKFVFDSF